MDTQTTPETPAPAAPEPATLLTWSAPSQAAHDRSHRWYVVGGALAVGFAAYGILTGSWPFAIVIILCAAMYMLLKGHTPPMNTIAIRENGILFEGRFTRWEDIEGYWILVMPTYGELHVAFRDKRRPQLVIQTGEVPLLQIRTTIGSHITELTDKHETLIDMIIRICKL